MHLGGSAGEGAIGEFAVEAVFVHDPVGLLCLGSSSGIKHESFLHSHEASPSLDFLVFPGRLPVAGIRRSVCPQPGGVLAISHAEEEPFLLSHLRSH